MFEVPFSKVPVIQSGFQRLHTIVEGSNGELPPSNRLFTQLGVIRQSNRYQYKTREYNYNSHD
jgi:hypothetical protein